MKKLSCFLLMCVYLVSCTQSDDYEVKSDENGSHDQIFAYSVFTGLANKIYDGTLTVGELKQEGDIGLGTFNGLDGEMVVVNGTVYQVQADWTISKPADDRLIPFAVVTPFEIDYSIQRTVSTNYDSLKAGVDGILPSENMMYAFRLKGKFDYVKCGSAPKQIKPYQNTISEALVNRPMSERTKIGGTIVGFWLPEYFGDVNVAGFHMHFMSDSEDFGGHLLEFETSDLKIEVDHCWGYQFLLPNTKAFKQHSFDLNQQYSKKK